MTRWVIFAEGVSPGMFDPLDQIRPAFFLRDGAWTVAERWLLLLQPVAVSFLIRPFLADLTGQSAHGLGTASDHYVNALPAGDPDDVWLIRGVCGPAPDQPWELSRFQDKFSWSNGEASVLRFGRPEWDRCKGALSAWAKDGAPGRIPFDDPPQVKDRAPLLAARGLWDLVNCLPSRLASDCNLWRAVSGPGEEIHTHTHPSTVILAGENVWAAPDVQIGPHVVVDARRGPVILDRGVEIEPFTRLDGPVYIGPFTRLVGGKITGGCAFGPGCRIGGEVESSIVEGFSNKVHDGFFGHGFIGEWVNLGALTTNSDLKNNYGPVRVVRRGESVETGSLKVGSYLADHTKTAIGILLPTGSSVGVGSNLLHGGLVSKSVPPFVWGGAKEYTEHRLEKMLETAKAAIARRQEILRAIGRPDRLTPAEMAALRAVYEQSAAVRAMFLKDAATVG